MYNLKKQIIKMAVTPRIKYYPVDNGDTSLISLSDETKILVDINITNDSTDDKTKDRFDVLSDLLDNELKNKDGQSYVDAFILTHPDIDHCRGYEDYFYQGDPEKYSAADKKNKLIVINELWYTPRVFEVYTEELNSDATAFKEEAKRRMDLYKTDQSKANTDGNRIRIVGYTDNEALKGLEARIITPGDKINNINGSDKKDFTMFIHAPFKDAIDGDDANKTSIVFQARFDSGTTKEACMALWGGDSGWRVWKSILDNSKKENIEWDLFLAPHHCSWTFFNDNTEEGKKKAQQSSLDILSLKKGKESKVIASCKEILKNDDNPPSHKAKSRYIETVGEDNFLVTAEHPNTKSPKPIEFEIGNNGAQEKSLAVSNVVKSTVISNTVTQPKTYGE